MADFRFIAVPELRACLEEDFRQLEACLRVGAWKAVLVLAGSIVEAVLIDALQTGDATKDAELYNKNLADLVRLARAAGMLSEETTDLSTVVRKYRNLIHPGRLTRLEKVADASGARVAAEVVEIVTREVAKRKKETYGYTAEQLLARLESGATALPLISRLIESTPTVELSRLLTTILPNEYMGALSVGEPLETSDHLATCYRRVLDAAPAEVKSAVAAHLYHMYRHDSEAIVVFYEDSFLQGKDLAFLDQTQRQFIKDHLLPRITQDTAALFLDTLKGIGAYLTPSEASSVAKALLSVLEEKNPLHRKAVGRLAAEYGLMAPECRKQVEERIGEVGHMSLIDDLKNEFVRRFWAASSP